MTMLASALIMEGVTFSAEPASGNFVSDAAVAGAAVDVEVEGAVDAVVVFVVVFVVVVVVEVVVATVLLITSSCSITSSVQRHLQHKKSWFRNI